MNSSLLLISGLAWLVVGFIFGNFIAINRLIHSEELKAKLEDLREIRYEAERARTLNAVAQMLHRVNMNILNDILKEINRDMDRKLNEHQD